MPPAAQVRDSLERILSSDVFARSERARDLLRYLVDQDLAGHADRLKGFSIAIDVFRKDERFDPSTDTVVRVQAGRLRDLLEQYYDQAGPTDPLRISIPRGSYVPTYTVVEPAAPPAHLIITEPVSEEVVAASPRDEEPDTPADRSGLFNRSAIAAAGIVMLLLVAIAAFHTYETGQEAVAQDRQVAVSDADTTGSTTREFLPAIYLDVSASTPDVERLVGLLRRGLSGFDMISFIARAPEKDAQHSHRRTDFVLLVDDDPTAGIHVELQNLLSGKVLLSRDFDVSGDASAELEDEVADLLTTIAPASGLIYASLAEHGAETVLTRCLLLNERYYREPKAEAHRAAYDCLLDLAAIDIQSSLVYSELAGLHVQAIASRYHYPDEQSEKQALEFARKAVQLAPNSPYAHRSMGYVLSRASNAEEALRWTRKAYELNTFDLGIAASYGYGLIFEGDYEEGTPILQRAATAASAHPPWWDYGVVLGHLMLGDVRPAANASAALAASTRAHYLAVRLIIAHELRDDEAVDTLRTQLKYDQPNFVADPKAFFLRGGYPEDMTRRLMGALRETGLIDAS